MTLSFGRNNAISPSFSSFGHCQKKSIWKRRSFVPSKLWNQLQRTKHVIEFSNICLLFSFVFHPFVPFDSQKKRWAPTKTRGKCEPRRHHQGRDGRYTSNATTSTGISHQISPLDTSHTTLFLWLQEPLLVLEEEDDDCQLQNLKVGGCGLGRG